MLKDPFRTLGELETNKQSIDLIDSGYKAGAVQMITVEMDTYPDRSQGTGNLVVPEEVQAGKRIFKWASEQPSLQAMIEGGHWANTCLHHA